MTLKNNVVSFKLSDAEAELLQKKVVNSGYKNKSEYFRKVVLGESEKDKIDELKEQINELKPDFAKLLEEKIVSKETLDETEKDNQQLTIENAKLKNESEKRLELIKLAKEELSNIIKKYEPKSYISYINGTESESISTESGWQDFVNSKMKWLIEVTNKRLPDPKVEKEYKDENEKLNSQLKAMQDNENKLNDYVNYVKLFSDLNKEMANDDYKRKYENNFFDLKNVIENEYYLPDELKNNKNQ